MLFTPTLPETHPIFAYFSMEVGLDRAMPTYSGGLGVLAGDTLRAAADLGVPLVAVTLLHRRGYFRQRLDAQGNQTESQALWAPEEHLTPLPPRVSVIVEGREVWLRAWRYPVVGVNGHMVPVHFLDSNLPENSPEDRHITDNLYGGDARYRLSQEVLLGIGGVAMLQALGYTQTHTYHMNEGHSALLTLALLEREAGARGLLGVVRLDYEAVRRRCVFTTHTPVPAGHDQFPWPLVQQVLGPERAAALEAAGCCLNHSLNLTHLALRFARYINGVSLQHEAVSRSMFPNYPINSITNGVHAVTWTATPFRSLFDCYIPEWRTDNTYLRHVMGIPLSDIRHAHQEAKADLINLVGEHTGQQLAPDCFTIGFARRAAGYKRADFLFHDLERLQSISHAVGPLQVVYGGKAHPRDESGKELIRRVFAASRALQEDIKVVYVEEYDMALAKIICAGVDLWLNTPLKPHEASGTSGMKAALNGVPSLSVLDGWWVEGCQEGTTGWAIADAPGSPSDPEQEAQSMYDKLEKVILPLYYRQPDQYAAVMRGAIALNGSFFNTQRMMFQYVEHAYQPYV